MKIDVTHEPLKGYTSIKKITRRLKELGLNPLPQPTFDLPVIPDDLQDKPGRFVWQLLNQLTRWHEFLNNIVAMYEIREDNLQQIYNDLHDFVYIELARVSKQKMTVDERKRLAALNPEVRKCKEELMRSQADAKLLKARKSSVHRNLQTVSRGVTILESEVHAHTREHSVGAKTSESVERKIRNR